VRHGEHALHQQPLARGTGRRRLNAFAIADDEDDVRASASNFLSVSTAYLLAAGDEVRLKVQQNSGGNLTVIASSGGAETSPELSMTLLGPA
jgi:hypothetical protein